jgi:hypothetical protein
MTTPWGKNRQRLLGLLADRAVFGLTAAEDRALQDLLGGGRSDEFDEMEQIAAACCLGLGIDVTVPLPAGLQDRVRLDARRMLRQDTIPGDDKRCQKT